MYSMMTQLVEKLCDTLVKHQIVSNDSWDGGIVCPYSKAIIGRSGDAVFPLYFSYLHTGNDRYLVSARKLVEYTRRIQLPDGGWTSHEMGSWKGTTVFKTLALIHAFDILQKQGMNGEAEKILDLIEGGAAWTSQVFGCELIENNVNYFVTSATVLEWVSRILKKPEYSEQGKKLIEKYGLRSINRDGFLLGESTKKSIMPVDIGYNLDMSLGAMAEYAILTGDPLVKSETVRALKTHVCFIYPDGSIDNSFGCRSYKWTMFGSKTAQGSQVALCLLCDEDPVFARSAVLNLKYLESCLSDDYLIGYGPDYWKYFQLGAIHSTFNRADAMALAVTYGKQPNTLSEKIPTEELFGERYYPSINVEHIRTEKWMATISGFATRNSPSGGSISYLWNESIGPVQLGCVTEYDRDDEPQNIPEYPVPYRGPITPRMEIIQNGKTYSNLYEYESKIFSHKKTDEVCVTVLGRFRDRSYRGQDDSGLCYSIEYCFSKNQVIKKYFLDLQYGCEKIKLIEPIVCSPSVNFKISNNGASILNPSGTIELTGSGDGFQFQQEDSSTRIFSVFPSVACLPVTWQRSAVAAGIYSFTVQLTVNSQ